MANIWGWLNPLRDKLAAKELTNNEHTFNYEGHKGFKILRSGDDDVQLEDIGGVFVGKKKVGAGKKIALTHNDKIATRKSQLLDYVYLNKSDSDIANNKYPKEISNNYRVSYMLGKGGFGEVYLMFQMNTSKRFALKVIPKVTKNENYFETEVEIMRKLKHPCCVGTEQVVDGVGTHYVVLEHMAGGDLARYIAHYEQLTEGSAKIIFYQLALAMDYLHTQNIVHRDIKPENILLASKARETLIKVTDFGVSKVLHDNTVMKSMVGTLWYMAPELQLLQLGIKKSGGQYTNKVDVWSMGILLYNCLTSKLPFANFLELAKTNFEFGASVWYDIPDITVSLLKKMLMSKSEERIGVSDILNEAWLQDKDMREKADRLMKGEDIAEEEEILEFVGVVFVKKLAEEGKRVAYIIGLNEEESWIMGYKDFIYDSSTA